MTKDTELLKEHLAEAHYLLNMAKATGDAEVAWKLVDLIYDQCLLKELIERL